MMAYDFELSFNVDTIQIKEITKYVLLSGTFKT